MSIPEFPGDAKITLNGGGFLSGKNGNAVVTGDELGFWRIVRVANADDDTPLFGLHYSPKGNIPGLLALTLDTQSGHITVLEIADPPTKVQSWSFTDVQFEIHVPLSVTACIQSAEDSSLYASVSKILPMIFPVPDRKVVAKPDGEEMYEQRWNLAYGVIEE